MAVRILSLFKFISFIHKIALSKLTRERADTTGEDAVAIAETPHGKTVDVEGQGDVLAQQIGDAADGDHHRCQRHHVV